LLFFFRYSELVSQQFVVINLVIVVCLSPKGKVMINCYSLKGGLMFCFLLKVKIS